MKIERLILASLGVLPLTAGTCCGNTAFEAKNQILDITQAQLQGAMEAEGSTAETVSCEALCSEAYMYTSSFSTDECSKDIDTTLVSDSSADTAEAGDTAEQSQIVGTVTCSGSGAHYCEGRRPLGFQAQDSEYFAQSCYLEACSVIAFEQLVTQLQAWNAPQYFIERAKQALKDEVRHAAQMSMLAKRFDEEVPEIELEQEFAEDLFSVALHNATEGCVFETWAVLEAVLKSKYAQTKELRNIYAQIAKDEMEHAQFSWDLHFWLLERLSPAEKKQVQQAQREAIAKLERDALERFERLPAILGMANVLNRQEIIERFVQQVA